jgi:hypothetical protein
MVEPSQNPMGKLAGVYRCQEDIQVTGGSNCQSLVQFDNLQYAVVLFA